MRRACQSSRCATALMALEGQGSCALYGIPELFLRMVVLSRRRSWSPLSASHTSDENGEIPRAGPGNSGEPLTDGPQPGGCLPVPDTATASSQNDEVRYKQRLVLKTQPRN
jgi:hypothetical protein